jgi:uncharacterized lipoprotein YddW (UPF0748 family)
MKKSAIIVIALLSFLLTIRAQQSTKHEVRAVWLTTIGGIDWPHSYSSQRQKDELRRTLDQLQSAGINTVLFQARVRATTVFPSTMEPWDACLTGKPDHAPSYDPLRLVIDECHQRGMELHAWVVTIPIGKWDSFGARQLRKVQPSLVKKIGEEAFMNPAHPQTADYLARFCRDIVERYDVDGIHLDYIRYPETWPKARNNAERNKRSEEITRIVSRISSTVKAVKPWVKMSCSPIGKYSDLLRYRSGGWNARNAVSQDAQLWMRMGLMDELFPMMYFRDNQFFPFAIDWQEQAAGRIVVPGLGIYFLDPREGKWGLTDVTRQMNVARQLGMGHCYFRSKFLTDNIKGIYTFAQQFDATPALIPPMTWARKTPPSAPAQLEHNGQVLSWTEAYNNNDSPYLLYNVYASRQYPVDIHDAQNLVATRIRATAVSVPADKSIFYAVTACDRYGQESMPCQSAAPDADAIADFWQVGDDEYLAYWQTDDILITDGKWLKLPYKPSTLDAQYIIVETLQGQQLAFLPYKGRYAHIGNLPEGIYALRSLGRKGRNHRIGYFGIKHPRHSSR